MPRVKAGAHLDLLAPGTGMRSYSLCGDPAISDRWEIAVKREKASRGGSIWLHDELKVGDPVAASMPRCNFPIWDEASRHIMIAGGIGVTPFLAMAPVLERSAVEWVLHVLHRGGLPPCPDDLAPWKPARRTSCRGLSVDLKVRPFPHCYACPRHSMFRWPSFWASA